jgi:hypothetical protein
MLMLKTPNNILTSKEQKQNDLSAQHCCDRKIINLQVYEINYPQAEFNEIDKTQHLFSACSKPDKASFIKHINPNTRAYLKSCIQLEWNRCIH